MTALQKNSDKIINFIIEENQQKLYNTMLILKVDGLENQVKSLEDRLTQYEREQIFFLEDEGNSHNPLNSGKTLFRAKDKMVSQNVDDFQQCKRIVERALEILSDWEDIDDIKFQIQYAAVIIGKIDNLKKRKYISSDEVRNKICTLLRNVIRLNATEEVLSKEQVTLLKEGISLAIVENIQKDELFKLNRKLRKAELSTMPAWE